MKILPTLRTERLVIRPFAANDGPTVKNLAGEKEIAQYTLNIPHPYEDGMAEGWISRHAASYDAGKEITLAITLAESGELIGAIGLTINQRFSRAEMGYWIGVPYWGKGYCTEAARELVRFGFESLGLNRIHASHLIENPASGRVMQKVGMTLEGTRKQHVSRWGQYHDLVIYGLVRDDWQTP